MYLLNRKKKIKEDLCIINEHRPYISIIWTNICIDYLVKEKRAIKLFIFLKLLFLIQYSLNKIDEEIAAHSQNDYIAIKMI